MNKPFTPTQIVFAPTAACNLECAHCRVERAAGTGKGNLPVNAAVTFLEDCAAHGIDRIGFSGGEPFLALDTVEALIRAAVAQGLYFDRLMTNGVWFQDQTALRAALERICDAGFDGTVAVSVDDWHQGDSDKLTLFVRSTIEVFARGDCLELVSVLGRDGSSALARFKKLAVALGATLTAEDGIPLYIQDARHRENRLSGMEDGSGIYIPIVTLPYSAAADDPAAWKAPRWFSDDYCEGPGNVLYVHPSGDVAVCCGFANENPQLIAGTIDDGYEGLLNKARTMSHVTDCYVKGLGALRLELEKAGTVFPGKTGDICFFCDYLCKNQ